MDFMGSRYPTLLRSHSKRHTNAVAREALRDHGDSEPVVRDRDRRRDRRQVIGDSGIEVAPFRFGRGWIAFGLLWSLRIAWAPASRWPLPHGFGMDGPPRAGGRRAAIGVLLPNRPFKAHHKKWACPLFATGAMDPSSNIHASGRPPEPRIYVYDGAVKPADRTEPARPVRKPSCFKARIFLWPARSLRTTSNVRSASPTQPPRNARAAAHDRQRHQCNACIRQ